MIVDRFTVAELDLLACGAAILWRHTTPDAADAYLSLSQMHVLGDALLAMGEHNGAGRIISGWTIERLERLARAAAELWANSSGGVCRRLPADAAEVVSRVHAAWEAENAVIDAPDDGPARSGGGPGGGGG